MDEKVLAYFSSVNPLARKIIKDEEVLKAALGDEWGNLDWQKQEQLIDDFIVDEAVRQQYADVPKTHNYPPSFPKLNVEYGEKIIVDFENDCWTWQDEHSSPFSWRTKSQQDLTLADLEPDVLCKPLSKGKKTVEDEPPQDPRVVAPREFSVQSGNSIWESPFLQGVKKPVYVERSRSTSTSKSKESLTSRERSPEEVNYAFTGSIDDLSSTPSTMGTERSSSVSSGEILDVSPTHESTKPKRPRRRKSLTKSPIKISSKKSDTDGGFISLVSKKDEEVHAFDNPVISDQRWSTFANETPDVLNDSFSSSATASPSRQLLREPEIVHMDRGEVTDANYSVQGPGQVTNANYSVQGPGQVTNANYSVQGPGEVTDANYSVQGPGVDDSSKFLDGFDSDFQDATLVVEERDDAPDSQNASVLNKTGFDFLDNW